ncbi:succinylglutamate desuccinylase/aspartoacylase family protein [Dactylosporangium sp. CA-233914]|uniref:succinylglutamate desuccinylase/aspartoacylase family protein n=1 Tax=Dactylosporangium sp. CA-233914 TaxID=3239934 RepID=UPI003D91C31F
MSPQWISERLTAGDCGPGVTVYELDSGRAGPSVLVLGGVHGNEVGGIVGAGRLTAGPLELRAGRLRVVPVTHEAAFEADSRTGPADGGNLARSFPGDPAGSPTERLAALVGDRLIRGSDVLVDLHTSTPATDMPFFAGGLDDGGPAATTGVELAVAFGAGIVWTHGSLGPGRTLTLARQLGIPAIYVESPSGGVLDRARLDGYTGGVRNVLAHLGMLAAEAPPARPDLWLHGDGDTDSFTVTPAAGLFLPEVALLDRVERGQRVGSLLDPRGRELAVVAAPEAGHVATLQRCAVVAAGTPVVGVAPARPPVLDRPSDAVHARVMAA